MNKILKLSWLTFKNIIISKSSLLGVIVSFLYSSLWIFAVNPKSFKLLTFTTEYFRLLYVIILYFCFKIIGEDIKNNVAKILFTGNLTRAQVIHTKIITLLFIGIFFSILGEINNLFVALILNNKFGILEFLKINHVNFVTSIIVLTFTMGTLCLFIYSFNLKSKIISTITIIVLGVLNFNTSLIVTAIECNLMEPTNGITIFMKTPIYMTANLIMKFQITNLLYIVWGVIFYLGFMAIMTKKEIC